MHFFKIKICHELTLIDACVPQIKGKFIEGRCFSKCQQNQVKRKGESNKIKNNQNTYFLTCKRKRKGKST